MGVRGPSRPAPYTRLLHLHPKMAPVEWPKERPQPRSPALGMGLVRAGCGGPGAALGWDVQAQRSAPPCPLWPHWSPGLDCPRQLLLDSSATAKSWPRQAGQEVT